MSHSDPQIKNRLFCFYYLTVFRLMLAINFSLYRNVLLHHLVRNCTIFAKYSVDILHFLFFFDFFSCRFSFSLLEKLMHQIIDRLDCHQLCKQLPRDRLNCQLTNKREKANNTIIISITIWRSHCRNSIKSMNPNHRRQLMEMRKDVPTSATTSHAQAKY